MKKQTAGRDRLGDFAPKFAQLNDDVLFGEVWSRENKMSAHDRSLITVASLITQGVLQLKDHIKITKKNGGIDYSISLLCWLAKSMVSHELCKRNLHK
jgi:4-carboxymuconolactone decarboxylase